MHRVCTDALVHYDQSVKEHVVRPGKSRVEDAASVHGLARYTTSNKISQGTSGQTREEQAVNGALVWRMRYS
jgi:hypothetical protein